MCINQTHMNFLELFLTLIHIKMRPTTTNDTNEHVHRNIWGYTSQSACTHTSTPTHTHSIPVGVGATLLLHRTGKNTRHGQVYAVTLLVCLHQTGFSPHISILTSNRERSAPDRRTI